MVAVLHSGIVCARCEAEVLAERPANSKRRPETPVSLTSPTLSESIKAAGRPVFRFDAAHPHSNRSSGSATKLEATTPLPRGTSGSGKNEKKTSLPNLLPSVGITGSSRHPQPGATEPSRMTLRVDGIPEQRPVSPNSGQGRITGLVMIFFAGQSLIAWAWFASSFPAFAGGIVMTLFSTGMLLQTVHNLLQQNSGPVADKTIRTNPSRSHLQNRNQEKTRSSR